MTSSVRRDSVSSTGSATDRVKRDSFAGLDALNLANLINNVLDAHPTADHSKKSPLGERKVVQQPSAPAPKSLE